MSKMALPVGHDCLHTHLGWVHTHTHLGWVRTHTQPFQTGQMYIHPINNN